MRRLSLGAAALVVVVLVASQLLLPPYLERRLERQMTSGGGNAHVELSAFPALRLLARHGDRVRVRASGLSIGLVAPTSAVLHNLDGFGTVDLVMTDSQSGPFKVTSARIQRDGSGPYRMSVDASATSADLAGLAGGEVGRALGSVAGGLLGFGSQPIPIKLTASVVSDNGRPVVETVDSTVAGIPAGPVVQALAAALANRI